jgi:hypothetical protein
MKERKLLDQFREFQSRSMRAYLEGWEGYWKFQAEVVRDPSAVPAAYARLADVNLKSYKTVVDASVELAQHLFGAPDGTAPAEPAVADVPAEPAAPAVKELVFEAAAGDTASRQFVVANKTDQPLDVAFEVSEFNGQDDRKFRAAVDLIPPTFTLAPGEEKIIECRIPLVEVFEAGQSSRAILRAIGLPEMSMVLTARAL